MVSDSAASARLSVPNAGCYNCGGGKDQVLTSKTVNATSVALCERCEDMQTVPRMPFDYRQAT